MLYERHATLKCAALHVCCARRIAIGTRIHIIYIYIYIYIYIDIHLRRLSPTPTTRGPTSRAPRPLTFSPLRLRSPRRRLRVALGWQCRRRPRKLLLGPNLPEPKWLRISICIYMVTETISRGMPRAAELELYIGRPQPGRSPAARARPQP